LLCLCLTAVYARTYEGFQVLRVNFRSDDELFSLLDLSERFFVDVWTANSQWADVMVSPKQAILFSNFSYEIAVEDVQATLTASQEENEAARAANPEALWDFTTFPTSREAKDWVDAQAALHAGASIVNIGKTFLGKEITGIAFGNPTKPVFYMHCTIHAREWIATTSCLWIINELLNNDPARANLLNNFYWIVVPIQNIDGYEYTFTNDRLWRKNREPNSGSTCIGTDINRNYGYQWGGNGASSAPCSETYRGRAPWSSPEAQSENTFLNPYLNAGRVAAYVDIHSYGGYFLSAWGFQTTTLPVNYPEMDRNMVECVTAIRFVNGRTYTYGPSGRALYVTSGSTVDQYYGQFQVINSYTIECYGTNFTPPTSFISPIGREVYAGIKQLAAQLMTNK